MGYPTVGQFVFCRSLQLVPVQVKSSYNVKLLIIMFSSLQMLTL